MPCGWLLTVACLSDALLQTQRVMVSETQSFVVGTQRFDHGNWFPAGVPSVRFGLAWSASPQDRAAYRLSTLDVKHCWLGAVRGLDAPSPTRVFRQPEVRRSFSVFPSPLKALSNLCKASQPFELLRLRLVRSNSSRSGPWGTDISRRACSLELVLHAIAAMPWSCGKSKSAQSVSE